MRRTLFYRKTGYILVLLLIILCCTQTGSPVHARSHTPILAFYYTHYNLGNWSYDWMSDIPAPVYSSGDGEAINRHIEQAHTTGIDAFICNWRGPDDQTDGRCNSLRRRIEQSTYDLKMAYMPDLSRDSDPDMLEPEGLAKALHQIEDVYHQESYLRIQGKPVLIFTNPHYFGEPEDWRRFRNQVDLNRTQYWIVGTSFPSLQDNIFDYLVGFDAVFPLDISKDNSPANALSAYAYRLQRYNQTHQTNAPFIATVMPGFDDRRINPSGSFQDRNNGLYYQNSWQAVKQYNPTAIIINSFNNFHNGTHIEPSEVYGDAYIGLTRDVIQQFRANQPLTPQNVRYFPETGHYIRGAFRTFWEQNGGIERFGLPITEEFIRKSDNKIVQYFERVRFELRVVNNQPVVDMGLMGVEYAELYESEFLPSEPFQSTPNRVYFPQTGHSMGGLFKYYWETQGGLSYFGYPISEEITVKLEGGVQRQVQYFERARMELHGSTILLGRLGVDLAPCELLPAWTDNAPPDSPITEYDETPCAEVIYDSPQDARKESERVDLPASSDQSADLGQGLDPVARGRVYPQVVQPNTVQGFEAWDYMPGEQVSMWFNLPDGSTRSLPYVATADAKGYVLIGIQTERTDLEGQWSLVGQGLTSGRVVVAPFELRW